MAQPGAVPKMAAELGYPVVLKPTGLSASRGVIKANGSAAASRAERRIRDILSAAGRSRDEALLVEEYVPGSEVAVEGLLVDGRLEVMAFIDKPDPLEGPFFEETLLITPSRLPPETQDAVVGLVDAARKALGLRTGPIHAEVRIPPDGSPRLIELAARPIGGLCGRAFTFGLLNESLEIMLLRSALGLSTIDTTPARPASGVLMLPIPATGILNGVGGLDEAKAMVGVDDVSITIAYGRRVTALPEADRYLGFVFASGRSPKAVEDTLREASSVLSVTIDGEAMQPAVTAPDRP
jgi:predicted ATP-grasp superfamily ATP-dependent carboligase